ncbi:AMP binding protein [Auriscalpium vulgare]|uniref:AMP binding protein n=1 Tax=Auriscalpium vulgare TaxID=40419 RepID=A0ACB8SA17_9AGAM|nr:AMP binding protein [Auriscalpium vulgare]
MRVYTSGHFPPVELVSESIWTYLFDTTRHDPTLPAFIDGPTGRTLSRAELRDLTLRLAHGVRSLPEGARVRRGDTAMIFSPNGPGWPIVLLGLIAAGARATLANSAYTAGELAFQYIDSGARLLFVHPDLVGVAKEMFAQLGVPEAEARKRMVLLQFEGGAEAARKEGIVAFDDLLGHGALAEGERFSAEDAKKETVLLCYSSGTTGKPKGVETTHTNLTSVVAITKPAQAHLKPGQDVMIGVLPYYHIYGVVKLLLFPLYMGFPVVIMPKFDPDRFCYNIERYKVTAAYIVPPIILALIHHPAVTKYDMRTLSTISSGAAPLGAEIVDAAVKRLNSVGANITIGQGYGLTETSPVTHVLPPAYHLSKLGSIGPLLPNLEARLVADDDGDVVVDAKDGERGEVWIRGPIVMKGYLNNPTATANAITPDGWFKTGDIGVRDKDGFYAIVDRKKELIKYKGFQVPPAELEAKLLQHPDIVDAAVVGIDDPAQATELPRAYVVHRDGLSKAPKSFPQDVQKWIQSRVAKHKFLRGGVVVIDVVPKSAAGKILRKNLRERAKEEVRVSGQAKAKL